MDIEETIEVVKYYLEQASGGLPSDVKILSVPDCIIIIDGDTRPDRYNIRKEVIGDELYEKLMACKTN